MKLLIDTNIILDFMLQRDGFYETALQLLTTQSEHSVEMISASAVTDIHYTTVKGLKKAGQVKTEAEASMLAQEQLSRLINLVNVVPVDRNVIAHALELEWVDFEDAVQYSVALENGADYIVTRDSRGYALSAIPVVSARDIVAMLSPEANDVDSTIETAPLEKNE